MKKIKLRIFSLIIAFIILSLGIAANIYGLDYLKTSPPTVQVSKPSTVDLKNNAPAQFTETYNYIQPIKKESSKTEEIEAAINNYRKSKGLPELKRHDPLCNLAKIRVVEIQADWSHSGFESLSNDELSSKFCDVKNVRCTTIGENLSKGYDSVNAAMDGWKNSPEHNENMLGNYNVQCVAVSNTYIVSLFAYTTLNPIPSSDISSTKISYDRSEIDKWEKLIATDNHSKDSWEDAKSSDWYDQAKVNKVIDKLSDAIEIGNTIWNGYINSSITHAKLNELNINRNKLLTEVSDLIKDLNKGAYDNCKDDYEKLSKETGKNYDDKCDGFKTE